MSPSRSYAILFVILFLTSISIAQETERTATCRFEDGNAITIRYQVLPITKQLTVPIGKVWSPGDVPMFLFTDAPLQLGNANLEVRAYSLYVIAGKEQEPWTLIVNKNVDPKAAYDRSQDLIRIPMQTGELPHPRKGFDIILGMIGAQQCDLRIYTGKTGAFGAEFKQK